MSGFMICVIHVTENKHFAGKQQIFRFSVKKDHFFWKIDFWLNF